MQRAALHWLTVHDGDFDWLAYDRDPSHGRDYVRAVRDNVQSFGKQSVAPMSRALRELVLQNVD